MPQPESKYLLAIDPGLATGIAVIDVTEPMDPVVITSEELQTEEFYARMDEVFAEYAPNLEVVIEDFHMLSGDKTEAPWSLGLKGVIEYMCWKHGRLRLTIQSPGRKPFADSKKLHQVGFWHVGGEGHANDALRHALIYHVDEHPNWARKLIIR